MATIGWLKIGTAVDLAGLSKGMKEGAAKTQLMAGKEGAGKGAKDGAKASRDWGAELKDLGVTALTTGAALASGAAAGALAWAKASSASVTESKLLAERVGMSATAFQKLAYAAGTAHIDQEGFAHSVEKMNERLAQVAIDGAGPAWEALRRYGINARALTVAGPEQSLGVLLELLRQIQNPMERNAVAMDLFGKSGQGLINLAAKGKDGLAALGVEAEALGVALDSVSTEKLAESDQAFIKIGSAVEGLGNSIAVELAPYITAVADQMISWMTTGTKTGSVVAQAFDWIVTAIGGVADVIQVVQASFYTLRGVFNDVLGAMLAGIDALVQGFGWLIEKITGTKVEVTTFFKDWSEGMSAAASKDLGAAGEIWGKKWAHSAVREMVDEVKLAAQQRAEFNVKKGEAFRGGPAEVKPKAMEPAFAGALEMGSKEAYSSIVKSKAMITSNLQNKIETNTRLTAEATDRAATALARLAQTSDEKSKNASGGAGELGKSMTAGK